LSIDKAGTGYTLTATGSTVNTTPGVVVSSGFNILGALDHFAVTTPSSPQTAGTAFGITTITAQDANNNTVTSYTGTVALTETGGGAGGTVSPTQSSAFTAGVLSGQSVTLSKAGTLVTITVTDPGYLYQRTVTIDHTKVPNTDQSNFPVLVSGTYSYLATVANGGRVSNSNGSDIIFTSDLAGLTKLDHEIESYNATTGTVAFWVRVPTVSKTTDTVIYLWYGNSAISSSQENRGGVWDSSYKGVWHLSEAASPSVDSTANNNGSWLNTPVVNATAKIAGGLTFTGSSNMEDNISSTFGFGTSSVTMEAWVYLTSTTVSGAFIKIGGTSPNQGYAIGVGGTTYDGTGNVPIALYEGVRWIPATGKTYGTGWHHAILVIDASGHPIMYVDGASIYSDTGVAPAAPASSITYIGGYTGSASEQRHFSGTVDEVRISGAVRSADWISTEYNNQNSPSTFYTVGAEVNGAYGGTKSGVSGTFTVNPGAATKLAFGTQPSNTGAGSTITPAVTVLILDANNNVTSSTASVTVAIGTNPGGGALSGTLPKAAVAGTATFNDLAIDKPGAGYTLTAASTGLTGATSGTFDITVSGYWVNNSTGSDANSGLQSAPFATIGHAVSVMGNSGTLFVQVGNSRSSPYAANIVVTTAQAGTAGQRTLIQGVASGATLPLVRGTDPTADAGFDVQASYVTVDGFEIQNTQVGIYSEASNTGAQISNNYVLAGNLGYGIILDTTSNAVVTGNRAAPGSGGASFFGIWDWHGTGNRIDGNSVAGQGEGITSHYSTGLTIQRNVTAGNPMGIHISNATGPVTLYNNTVDQSAWLGIYVEQSQAGVTITSRDNIVTNGGYGWAWDGAGTMPSSNYDDVFGNAQNYRVPVTPGGNSIIANPNFVQTTDPTQTTYYQLNAGSQCLTSGTDLGLGLGTHIGAK
jgi:parallel beta-helix repeat protein